MDISDMTAANLDLFAVDAVYTPPNGGDAVSLSVLWEEDDPLPTARTEGERVGRSGNCTVRPSDIATPQRLGTVEIAGETWTVNTVRTVAGMHTLTLTRARADDFAPSHRR